MYANILNSCIILLDIFHLFDLGGGTIGKNSKYYQIPNLMALVVDRRSLQFQTRVDLQSLRHIVSNIFDLKMIYSWARGFSAIRHQKYLNGSLIFTNDILTSISDIHGLCSYRKQKSAIHSMLQIAQAKHQN